MITSKNCVDAIVKYFGENNPKQEYLNTKNWKRKSKCKALGWPIIRRFLNVKDGSIEVVVNEFSQERLEVEVQAIIYLDKVKAIFLTNQKFRNAILECFDEEDLPDVKEELNNIDNWEIRSLTDEFFDDPEEYFKEYDWPEKLEEADLAIANYPCIKSAIQVWCCDNSSVDDDAVPEFYFYNNSLLFMFSNSKGVILP